ncbi:MULTISPECIES: SRPBCC family protein [unclassified Novosphingobium]|uniref:aromatic ring-hydroxylating oxygenase subunit alpha n=1 Tax=unclassified Novosphingobium TaxID=2644732 RepID=UPI00135883C0|nr:MULTISPECIES: aromatic ring-hydroxylating dioxygenase subunit alpha [unclassified Novosphingobium]
MKLDPKSIIQGVATAVSPLYDDLLAKDTRTVHPALLARGSFAFEGDAIPRSRYFSAEFAKLERDHVWKKTWQFAAREEEIPEVGDRIEYAVAGMSFMIVHAAPGTFKAFWNSCLHRGRKLCENWSTGDQIKCPFHGWTWNIDGTMSKQPGDWDFPQAQKEHLDLPEVPCDTWCGNIFINPDTGAGPLSAALGVLTEHFADYEFDKRWTAIHVRKKVRSNWKVAMEAFLEGWHLSETHPQAQSFNGDSNTLYDIWEDEHAQISRSITPSAVPSPELGEAADTRAAVIEMCKAVTPPGIDMPDFAQIETLDRAFAAEYRRGVTTAMTGRDFSATSDAEMLDAVQYYMFPNWFPWWGEGAPLFYQYMPLGENPDECIMDIRFLLPMPANGERPPAAQRIDLDFDDSYQANNVGFGLFDEVFDQDMGNVPGVQQGAREGKQDQPLYFGRYQECRLRALHARIDRLCAV